MEAAASGQTGGMLEIPETKGTDVKTMIGMSVFYVVFGFLAGMVIGGFMGVFKTECCTKLSDKC